MTKILVLTGSQTLFTEKVFVGLRKGRRTGKEKHALISDLIEHETFHPLLLSATQYQ